MTDYIVNREELIAWFEAGNRTIDYFFADKQPVEMIAEGEVKQVFNNGGYHSAIGEYNTNVYFDKYTGKSIKIFIQEVK